MPSGHGALKWDRRPGDAVKTPGVCDTYSTTTVPAYEQHLIASTIIDHAVPPTRRRRYRSCHQLPRNAVPCPRITQWTSIISAEQDNLADTWGERNLVMLASTRTERRNAVPCHAVPFPCLADPRHTIHVSAKIDAPLPNWVEGHRATTSRRRATNRIFLLPADTIPFPCIAKWDRVCKTAEKHDFGSHRVVDH